MQTILYCLRSREYRLYVADSKEITAFPDEILYFSRRSEAELFAVTVGFSTIVCKVQLSIEDMPE